VPPFDSIDLSKHIPVRGNQRDYTLQEAKECIENPDLIHKTQGSGKLGGFIWRFRKSFRSKTLEIVAEVYKNKCYGITGYWI
jgi:hypothetical protein